MNYNKLDPASRTQILKAQLEADKALLIERHGLFASPDLKWTSQKENAHEQIFFTHSFALKSDILSIVFRINKLCFAKVKYFRAHLDQFEPCVYQPESGFAKTELWNSDFLKHKASGFILDYRFLQRITQIADFQKLCQRLESYEGKET